MSDLSAFLAVARERSFTRAASRLGLSPSALSHTMRALEERLGVRLLTRTTRSVSTTEAGERLLRRLGPHFDDIADEIEALAELRERPAGTIRITTGDHAASTILWPKLSRLLHDYPDLIVELSVESGLVDIVSNRFDAGVRLGETIAQDMIAVRIGPDMRMSVVGSPAYFSTRPPPKTPRDLSAHACINLRFPTLGGLYAWEFEKAGKELSVRVNGQVIVNDIQLARQAALDGAGLAYLPENYAAPHVESGALVRVLENWCPPFSGYHLYFPSRRQQSPALAVVIDALRYR